MPRSSTSSRRRIGAEDVQLYYQTAILGRRDLALAPDPRSGFEMTLVRMLAFRPAGSGGIARAGAAARARRHGAVAGARAHRAAGVRRAHRPGAVGARDR